MAGVQRGLALSSRLAAWQQLGGGLLGGLWQPAAGQAAPVLSRLTSLIPSLGDMAWLAVPKRKVRRRAVGCGRAGGAGRPWWASSLAKQRGRLSRSWLVVAASCAPTGAALTAVQVTPSRKGNRSATKFIRFVPVVSRCRCARLALSWLCLGQRWPCPASKRAGLPAVQGER